MVNKLSRRHEGQLEDGYKYVIVCPCCGTLLNFSKDDVYKSKDEYYTTQEYINCPECNESIKLNEEDYFGY